MGGEWIVKKPSRSDEVLDAEQQLRIADEIVAHFDSLTPKRPTKPNRSESESTTLLLDHEHHSIPPELTKFRILSSQSQQPICSIEGVSSAVQEEFVETQYYNKLISIDKQHHTTGTGFIKVSEGSGDGYELQLQQRRGEGGDTEMEFRIRSNPATDDWT